MFISANGNSQAWWTGGTDIGSEGSFSWVNEVGFEPVSFSYANWNNNEPNNAGGEPWLVINGTTKYPYQARPGEHCINYLPHLQRLNDYNCGNSLKYLCEGRKGRLLIKTSFLKAERQTLFTQL